MHLDITASTERLVRDELNSGHFQSVDDLIVSSVHAWRAKNPATSAAETKTAPQVESWIKKMADDDSDCVFRGM